MTLVALLVAALSAVHSAALGDPLREIIDIGAKTQLAAAQSQERIDQLSEDTETLLGRYRTTMDQIDSLRVYNQQLEELLAAQEREIASLENQIENITIVERQIMPLMKRMIDTLEKFVNLDVPFLLEERHKRVSGLKELMGRADVTVAEKYRRLMEAYQIENEYGRTIETYRGELDLDGAQLTVDFLKIGRIALVYRSLDGERIGAWDGAGAGWTSLGGSYRSSIQQGLRIAKKQVAPDLITMPVPAPQEAP
jgi:hypothetical protein